MNCIIPFTKDIKFNTNICEILSISLENEYTVNDNEILGNFIVSGDYKSHEVSVNKAHFEHVLPFSVNLTTRIDADSIDFAIEDFTYEIIDKNILKVNIEYSINALELKEEEKIFDPVEERDTLDTILDSISEELEEPKLEERKEDDDQMDTLVEEKKTLEEEKTETYEETRDDKISPEEENAILESVNPNEDTFVTYHIHVMSETDTIETICAKYNTTQNLLGEYNDLSTIAIGDKLIIPDSNE